MTVGSQEMEGEDGSDEPDVYDSLKLAEDQPEGGFKFNSEDSKYYLRDGFCLPKDIYENLFEH